MGLKDIQIIPMEGSGKLRDKMKSLMDTPGFKNVASLGIVRDADSKPNSTFQSVCDSLRYVGFSSPTRCLESVGIDPKVAVMLMPGNNAPGMLEDLCLESVRSNQAFPCIERYFNCLRSQGLTVSAEISKAKVHVFLASRKRPDLRLGVAAANGYWPFNSKVFDELKAFIKLVST
jgi:hypothetical protein